MQESARSGSPPTAISPPYTSTASSKTLLPRAPPPAPRAPRPPGRGPRPRAVGPAAVLLPRARAPRRLRRDRRRVLGRAIRLRGRHGRRAARRAGSTARRKASAARAVVATSCGTSRGKERTKGNLARITTPPDCSTPSIPWLPDPSCRSARHRPRRRRLARAAARTPVSMAQIHRVVL